MAPHQTQHHVQAPTKPKCCFWARGSLPKGMEVKLHFELTQRGQLREPSQAGLTAVTIPKKQGGEKKPPHESGKAFQFSKENPKSSTLYHTGEAEQAAEPPQGGMAKLGAASGLSSCVCLPAAFLPRQPRPGFVFLGCAGKQLLRLTHTPGPGG